VGRQVNEAGVVHAGREVTAHDERTDTLRGQRGKGIIDLCRLAHPEGLGRHAKSLGRALDVVHKPGATTGWMLEKRHLRDIWDRFLQELDPFPPKSLAEGKGESREIPAWLCQTGHQACLNGIRGS
jgi:hypothetical protein